MVYTNTMRRSFKSKYTVIFILLMLGILILCMAGSTRFLESYYIHEKQKAVLSLYAKLDNGDVTDPNAVRQIRLICSQQDLSLILLRQKNFGSYFAIGDLNILQRKLFTHMKSVYDGIPIGNTIKETENYMLKYLDDDITGTKELVLNGFLADGSPILISTPLVGIETNAGISNRFFMMTLLFSALIGGVMIYFITLKASNNELRRDLEYKVRLELKRRDFLSGVSHDLKTPIALIQGYGECLLESGDDIDREYYCNVIIDESRKMGELVKNLLTLEQIESDSAKDEIVSIELVGLINSICYVYEKYVNELGTQIILESDSKQLYIDTVEWKIEQILRNYISNALNHTDKSAPVQISVYHNRVSVYNPGAHIPPEAMDNIWDKFYKTDKSRSREYGGNGIGLSLVKAAQESMGLGYGVENVLGGVSFWFEVKKSKNTPAI